MKVSYNPAATFEIKVSEVDFRRNAQGRQLMARLYQPQGTGPVPVVLDLHGGAWNNKDRFAEEPMDRAIAASGVLVVAIDMTRAAEAPYPACVQDASYGVRWLKANASKWNGDASTLWLAKDGTNRLQATTYANGDAATLWSDKDGKTRMSAETKADGTVSLPTIDRKP